MNKKTLVVFLVLVVLAIFLFKPEWLGSGGETPSLKVINEDIKELNSDIPCDTTQDCIDAINSEFPNSPKFTARCEDTCIVITSQPLAGGSR